MFFFDDKDLGAVRKRNSLRIVPPTPETGWRPPQFPNLSAARLLSFDTETKELDFDHGPGWARDKGHIIGVSIAADDCAGNVGKWYFPIRHEVEPEYNLPVDGTLRFLNDVLNTPAIPKIGANLYYDIGWLAEDRVTVAGELHDVQYAEALLQEAGEVNLDFLGTKYCGAGKYTGILYRWCSEAYGGPVSDKQRSNLWRASPRLVGPYAEQDAELPLSVLRQQWPLLESEGLLDVYRMECDLVYLLVKMRRAGISVDIRAAERLYAQLHTEAATLARRLNDVCGFEVNVNAAASLAKAYDSLGVKYPRTGEGAPSFVKDWLKVQDDPISQLVIDIRARTKIRDTFVKGYILESHNNGKVHCTFNALRGDDSGARSGRYSAQDPNLQNIPIRPNYVEELLMKDNPDYVPLGKRMRELFVHDLGHYCVEKNDYSQIEYRGLVDVAVGPGSDEVRAQYNSDPHTDYHVHTQNLVKAKTGVLIARKPIKNINFGLLYGMGEPKLARQIGVDKSKAHEIFDAYHSGAPYVRATMDYFAQMAQQLGYVPTVLGRRSRFDLWEPAGQFGKERSLALPYERAVMQYGSRIQRASTHKAINRRLQGSAADIMKRAMWLGHKLGVFDVTGVPRITVHDELVFSVIDASPRQNEAYAYLHRVMENAIPMRVPVIVDSGRGPTWGAIE